MFKNHHNNLDSTSNLLEKDLLINKIMILIINRLYKIINHPLKGVSLEYNSLQELNQIIHSHNMHQMYLLYKNTPLEYLNNNSKATKQHKQIMMKVQEYFNLVQMTLLINKEYSNQVLMICMLELVYLI